MTSIAWLDHDDILTEEYVDFFEANDCRIVQYKNYDDFYDNFESENINIIISDWEVDGELVLDFIEKVRGNDKTSFLPLLIISASENQSNVTRALLNGATDYILKPVNPHILVGKIKYFLRDGHIFKMNVALKKDYIFANRYKIIKSIGSGGSSTVYQTLDLQKNEKVALKLMKISSSSQYDKACQLFLREVYIHSKLKDPRIVNLYDFGYHESFCFVTMECVEGRTLTSILEKEGAFNLSLVSKVAIEVVSALEYLVPVRKAPNLVLGGLIFEHIF